MEKEYLFLVYKSSKAITRLLDANICYWDFWSGNKLISFLNELELVICNGRRCVSEPEWTRVRPSLDQKL